MLFRFDPAIDVPSFTALGSIEPAQYPISYEGNNPDIPGQTLHVVLPGEDDLRVNGGDDCLRHDARGFRQNSLPEIFGVSRLLRKYQKILEINCANLHER